MPVESKPEKELIIALIKNIELSPTEYETAKKRYDSIGEHLNRENSKIKQYSPYIYPKGSFRIGTAVKPGKIKQSYDVDLVCELTRGYDPATQTQEELKELIFNEIKLYQEKYGMNSPQREKRCVRLEYSDHINFHIDIVPAISISNFYESTIKITDTSHSDYDVAKDNWYKNNPGGYAKWFEALNKNVGNSLHTINENADYIYAEKKMIYQSKKYV